MATFTNQTRNAATFTRQAKNAASFSNQSKGTSGAVLATAGLVMGMLSMTYSGGEVLESGSLPVFTNQTKN
jgi:hypothetical protein